MQKNFGQHFSSKAVERLLKTQEGAYSLTIEENISSKKVNMVIWSEKSTIQSSVAPHILVPSFFVLYPTGTMKTKMVMDVDDRGICKMRLTRAAPR